MKRIEIGPNLTLVLIFAVCFGSIAIMALADALAFGN